MSWDDIRAAIADKFPTVTGPNGAMRLTVPCDPTPLHVLLVPVDLFGQPAIDVRVAVPDLVDADKALAEGARLDVGAVVRDRGTMILRAVVPVDVVMAALAYLCKEAYELRAYGASARRRACLEYFVD